MTTTRSESSSSWPELLRSLPGYDPFASAGECSFDEETAQRAIAFFEECLIHIKGERAGERFLLEPWQKAIVANLFGWKRADGTRRYREALIFVPRKNGKSLIAAGLCNYMLFCDGEPGAESYCAAAERDQAALVFDVAKQQVLREPTLARFAKVYQKAIAVESVASSLKAISADASTKHGYNAHCVVIDELHAQRNADLVEVLLTSTAARRQPLVVHITTSDFDRESICNSKYDYATKVRDGVIEDPSFLPVIYEASRDDDWTDPTTWAKANPNLGVSVSREYLEHECRRAQDSPTYENVFKRLHLNIKTEQDVRWLSLATWDASAGHVDPEELRGRECFGGLDLASTTDVAAFSLVFPQSGSYSVLPFFWIPEENARERERRDRVPYLTWARQGLVEMTPGKVIDYTFIRKRIGELAEQYQIREIAVDRWGAAQITGQLADDGHAMVLFGQGFVSMSEPSKELERLVLSARLRHGGNPVLRWMASNVCVEMDAAGNIKPSKRRSSEKIDGVVATVMALGRATVAKPPFRSVYEDRGILVLGDED